MKELENIHIKDLTTHESISHNISPDDKTQDQHKIRRGSNWTSLQEVFPQKSENRIIECLIKERFSVN